MTVKYKVSDFAKDLSISAKKVLDELNAMGSTGKKNSSTLEENELNFLAHGALGMAAMDHWTRSFMVYSRHGAMNLR